MAKLSLTDISSGYAAPATINANNAAIEAALENTLSRDGTTPNTMSANLDMNSNRIVNLPAPVADTEPVRLVDVQDGSIDTTLFVVPSQTGNSGKALGTNGSAAAWRTVADLLGVTLSASANKFPYFTAADTMALADLPLSAALGGTGVANNAAATLTRSGNHALTFTTTGTTSVTLPTSGTLYGTASGSITSAQLAASLSDETGSGPAVFATTPTFTTGIGVGGATAQSGGIAFPATSVAVSNANTLDDYEEGTFTPILNGATTTTYASRGGSYIKIGKHVHFELWIAITSIGDGNNSALAGLPFTSAAQPNGDRASCPINYFSGCASSLGSAYAYVNASATSVQTQGIAGDATGVSTYSFFQNGTQLALSGDYTAAN